MHPLMQSRLTFSELRDPEDFSLLISDFLPAPFSRHDTPHA